MSEHDSGIHKPSLQARIRAAIILVLLAVTVFILAWGTLTVVETSPQVRILAVALWLVGIVIVSLRGVRLRSVTDEAWIMHSLRTLGEWAGKSWPRLGLSVVILAATCYLAWLSLFAATVTVTPASQEALSRLECVVGWALVKVPCADKPTQLWAPLRQVNLYLEGTMAPCTRSGSTFTCEDPGAGTAAGGAAFPDAATPDLYIYFQMSKALEYERSIRDGFLQGLNAALDTRYNIVFKQGIGTTGSYWNSVDRWRDIVDEIVSREPLTQYVVTVGSDAATAMVELEAESRFNSVPGSRFAGFLFLGVSDPVRAGLAERETSTSIPGRAAVQYGSGANDWAATILHALDESRLLHRPELIYDTSQLQDSWVAAQLQSSPLNGHRVDITGPIEGNLGLEDLEKHHIYFAWYSLDALVESYSSRMDDFLIVPSTFSEANTRNFGLVVSVDDAEVGETGARYLAMALTEGQELEELPTIGPPFRIWINCSGIERKGIPLSPQLRRSEVTFVPDAGERTARNDCVGQ